MTLPALLVRFRPLGPWRIGPSSGACDQVDRLYHSDTLFSAVTSALAQLGMLEEWLAATVHSPEGPRVAFSSCFPYSGDLLLVVPPRTLWPPAASPKVRWKSARFIPLSLVAELVAEEPLREDRWVVDPPSQCLLPLDRRHSGPFRQVSRSHAAVDRLSGSALPHSKACLEFAAGAGLWAVAVFAGEEARERWKAPVEAAFRLLADSGLGGRRSLGWGRSEIPEVAPGVFPEMLSPPPPAPPESPDTPPAREPETVWWLLSLFLPAPEDSVDWARSSYALATRGGRIESPLRSGEQKRLLRMVEEGSVLRAAQPLRGAARNVAPEGFPHPVFRAGFAVAVPVPLRPPEVKP
jgi:CRISPR type III-A-associated RAMP protein Csm4